MFVYALDVLDLDSNNQNIDIEQPDVEIDESSDGIWKNPEREEGSLAYRNLVLLGWKKVDKLVYLFLKFR